jgi:putative membrane protein
MRTLMALLLTAFLVSCGSMSTTMPGRLPANDIAGILATANQGEIDQANAALSKATNADVRAFAQMMVTDHTNAASKANDVFSRNGITPADNSTTSELKTNGQRSTMNLNAYSGAAFDRAYMQAQVDMHSWLLTNLDSLLIPSARGDLRTLLESTRGTVSSHLDKAREILGRL